MRSQPSVFVNCDKCQHEQEVLLEPMSDWRDIDEYVSNELKSMGWLITQEEEDICEDCQEVGNEPTTSAPNSAAPKTRPTVGYIDDLDPDDKWPSA